MGVVVLNSSLPHVAENATWGLNSHYGAVDFAILILVLVASVLVGVISGWKKSSTSTKDFLVGAKDMNPVAVAFSLVGGVISSISIQGNSTEVYLHGTQLWMNLVGCAWGTLIVMFLFLPVFYPLNLTSLCQYLELRFKSPLLKKIASLIQVMNNIMFLGICLYAPSLTLSSAMAIPTSVAVFIFGSICAVYVTLGGIRGVVYTDIVQTTMMFVGVLAVVIQVVVELGGVSKVWNIAMEGGRLEFFNFDPNPLVRHTFWSVQVLGLNFVVGILGISQPQFQRLTSVRSLRISQGLCVAFLVGVTILWSLFYSAGLIAYAAYADCDPISSGQVEKADQILAYLVADKLSYLQGMVGLFVAAVAGALLSSMSSYVNSTVVLLWEDILSDWKMLSGISREKAMLISRMLCCLMVAVSIGSALFVSELGTLFETGYSITGALVSPFDGVFITAIIVPWANAKGVTAGFLSAITFNLWLGFSRLNYGGGKTEGLPLSTEGCLYNSSYADTAVASSLFNASAQNQLQTFDDPQTGRDYLAIYDISYCYIGSMGILIVIVVSSIVSIFTGAIKPAEVDQRLVNPNCFRIYRWVYNHLVSETTETSNGGEVALKDVLQKPNKTEDDIGNPNTSDREIGSNNVENSTITSKNSNI